jgi:hypothetical protein
MGKPQREWTDEDIELGLTLYDDYEQYARECIKIKPKNKRAGALVPLIFNTAQKYIHYKLEEQMRDTGKVEAVILKGRQQGCSTYICGRFVHKSTLNYGIKVHVQTHSQDATSNLFQMSKRSISHLPHGLKPHISVSNISGIVFDQLDSAYSVGTAGGKESGRSDNIDLLHCSELAFWDRPYVHLTGLLAAAESGQEKIYESTANGMGGCFYSVYTQAQAGLYGDFIAIFVPWYWQEEYTRSVPEGFALTDKEQEYKRLYNKYPVFHSDGSMTFIEREISDGQFAWRRDMVAKLGSESKANQEYPFDANMAFQFSAIDSYIPAESVVAAMKRPQYRSYGAIVAGYDPAFLESGDRKAFIYRQGANAWGLEYPKLKDHDAQVAYIKRKLDSQSIIIDRLFMDFGGGGCNIYQCLLNDGYGDRVTLVNSGKSADEDYKYANKKAEMSARLKDHLLDNDMPLSIDIEDDLESMLQTDLTAEGFDEDRNNRLIMEKKEKVKLRLGISPDGGDALKLTYADKIVREHVMADPMADIKYIEPEQCVNWFDQ